MFSDYDSSFHYCKKKKHTTGSYSIKKHVKFCHEKDRGFEIENLY